jgi:hypothetical protein
MGRIAALHASLAFSATLAASAGTTAADDYTVPQPGAQWVASTWTGPNAGFVIGLENASLTLEGFTHLECPDGSFIVVGQSSTLNVADCHFRNITQADTAPIDTGPMGQSISTSTPISDVVINVENSSFEDNLRGILTRSVQGTTQLTVSNTLFANNSAWPIEYRVGAGDHSMTLVDSELEWSNNTPVRLYAFHNQNPALATNYQVTIDRTLFTLGNSARAALVLSGVESVAHPSSGFDLQVTNSVFDLREAANLADTSAINMLPETSRRGTATVRHATVATGGSAHSGVVWRGGSSNALTVLNSIVDGPGTAFTNTGSGTVVSGINLLNTTAIVSGSGGAALSGQEIVGISPQFLDRDGGDFRIAADSPAEGAGADLGVAVDLNGAPRPAPTGTNPDLGAFEHGTITPPPILGDIDGDGVINVTDVTLLGIRIASNDLPELDVADINNDGFVNELDLSALADLVVGSP